MSCPLCASANTEFYLRDKKRAYRQCLNCYLVYVPKPFHLSLQAEKAEYDKHNNSAGDRGYRQFLGRLVKPILPLLPSHAEGLDFGCGPGPAIASMMSKAGKVVHNYDPYYFNDKSLLARTYDFVVATEVVEHLCNPEASYEEIWRCVEPGGYFGLMTKLVLNKDAFSQWHYKNDPTHISFHSLQTLHYLSNKWNASLNQFGADAFIFQKPPGVMV